MAEQPSETTGPARPALPWILFAAATAIAVLATTGFVYLLNKRTTGPVEVLRDFYQAAHNLDCVTSHAILNSDYQRELPLDEWCEFLQGERFPPAFQVRDVSLAGDIATVRVDEGGGIDGLYQMERDADGDGWRIRLIVRGEPVGEQGIPDDSSLRSPETPAG